MCHTLVVINSRFIFQIGGFEDVNYDIYRFDMDNCSRGWKKLYLDLTKPVVDLDLLNSTRRHLQERLLLSDLNRRASEDDSDE